MIGKMWQNLAQPIVGLQSDKNQISNWKMWQTLAKKLVEFD